MHPIRQTLNSFKLSLYLLVIAATGIVGSTADSPLTEYIELEDENYSWTIQKVEKHGDLTFVVIDLKSLEWLSPDQVNRPQWQHWLELYIPKQAESEIALLYVGGGRNGRPAPEFENSLEATIALQTQSVVGLLGQVPNQKLIFNEDAIERREDRLLAHAWTQFNAHNDPHWIPLLPMVKSVVRALDAIVEITASDEIESPPIKEFVVTGGSKRGWTTWLSAVADERIVAIVPAVFDALNSARSMEHHFEAYGYWSHAIVDYFAEGLLGTIDATQTDKFFQIADPYRYLDQLKIPKFSVNATGDEFFLLDSTKFYWDDLKGAKFLRYVPNSDHSLEHTDVIESIATFHWLIQNAHAVPNFEWDWTESATVEIDQIRGQVSKISMWSAHNPVARDFRLLRKKDSIEAQGPTWDEKIVFARNDEAEMSTTPLTLEFESDGPGWHAHLVEVEFDVGFQYPLKLTTTVSISPTTLPFAEKEHSGTRHITFNCPKSTDSKVPSKVLEFLKNSFKTAFTQHVVHNERDYFCWQPKRDPRLEGALFVGFLQTNGYHDCIIQLEAGVGPTLPPLSSSPTENVTN
ncbi:MAG: PhoPQ-activated protein PqaA family protein [Gammaproteobacteria bacterium]|nr:PhoPQ-activated protein PqaA family protein [Gammaproteobacteria bacterium]